VPDLINPDDFSMHKKRGKLAKGKAAAKAGIARKKGGKQR
jgi:hypothetical protein